MSAAALRARYLGDTVATAMEKALGSLQNQSTWLNGQLAALPSWSSSKS